MKKKKNSSGLFASILMLIVCITASASFAQTKMDSTMMNDCCMMKGGKMMYMKDGKTMPMEHNMTMKNGTTCMTNGECVMKDGKKMKMKEGECMDMSGKMDKCSMMNHEMKSSTDSKTDKQSTSMSYACPMHPEQMSDKAGKCPKCGMDMEMKK